MTSQIPCLICSTLVPQTVNLSQSSYLDDQKKIILFLSRNLLEIPEPLKILGNDSKEDNRQCSVNNVARFLVTCEHCKDAIKEAKLIYSEIKKLALKFRGIQKKIVDILKSCSEYPGDVTDEIEYCKRLVKNCDYNGFGFPFVVRDDKEEEDDQTTSCEVVVKEEEGDRSGHQEILLIFPEDENMEENDNDNQDSQMDSEEEDSDYQFSQPSSEDGYDDDNQASLEDSEDDQVSGMDSEEDEDPLESFEKDPSGKFLSSFICKKCLQRFPTKAELEKHHETSHFKEEWGTFPCPLKGCSRTYTYSGKFPQHFKLHHCGTRFVCKSCEQEFPNLDQVRIHHKQTHPPLRQPIKPSKPCPLCSNSVKNWKSLRAHIRECHPDNSIPLNELKLKFLPPSKASSFEQQYPQIICKKNSDGKFPCPWTDPSPCSKISRRRGELYNHIKAHHLNIPLYTCNWSEKEGICGKTYETRTNYQDHLDEHRGTPKYKCEECQLTFYKWNVFKRHQERVHLGVKFMCEICGQEFSCKEYLNSHINVRHHGRPERRQKAQKRRAVDQDVEDGDEEGPGIICDLCGQLLKNKLTLKAHMIAKHEKIPGKYCCHLCDKRFRVSTHLNLHLWQRHQFKVEGFQPKEMVARKDKFQCEVTGCRMALVTKEGLERHRKKFHGEDGKKPGPFNCKHCGKNFFQRAKWQQCERTHENKESRPEKCEVCGKGFPTMDHLKFHLRHTHKMQLEDNRGWRKGK